MEEEKEVMVNTVSNSNCCFPKALKFKSLGLKCL